MQNNNNKHGDILVVDDTLANVNILKSLLQESGYSVRAATSGKVALMICEKRSPDLVLLDVRMPEMDGYEVCRRLKAGEKTREIAVIFISALNTPDDKMEAFEAGGVDFISKPFDVTEVLTRVKTHVRLQMLQRQLREKNRELAQLAATDPLTGLYNRRSFLERLRNCQYANNRYGTPCSLLMFDLDNFKTINDQYGHNVGDQVLQTVAERTRRLLRETDVAARWGGEEFMILAPHTGQDDAVCLAERLRKCFAEESIEPVGRVTASFGIAQNDHCNSLEALTHLADQALYAAKAAGRNCVRIASTTEEGSHDHKP